ncbi:MAG: alpha/beta hydrolase [Paludibacter sp.]
MKRSFLITNLLLTIFMTCFSQETNIKKVQFPENYQSKIDVVYSSVNGWDGRIDIYYNPTSTKPTPIVLHIHGGGWNHGTKESQSGFSSYFKAGFAVANVEYRLVQVAPAPAAIEDIRCALKYIKAHAKELNINPDKVVIEGGSSGAHLALMGGLLENDNRFDGNCPEKTDMRVAAIISNYAPTDFTDMNSDMSQFKSLTRWLGNKADDLEFRASVSPITHIKKTSPPVFIVHGNADNIVPYNQSVNLQKKLAENGIYNEFITVEGGGHGTFEKERKAEIAIALFKFLKKTGVIE